MVHPAPSQDYYKVLEVKSTATRDEIKTSYRRLTLLFHPGKNGGSTESTEKIQMINTVWEVLRDDDSRREYDATHHRIFIAAQRAQAKRRRDEANKRKKGEDGARAKREADEAAQRKKAEAANKHNADEIPRRNFEAEEARRDAYFNKRTASLGQKLKQERLIHQSRERLRGLENRTSPSSGSGSLGEAWPKEEHPQKEAWRKEEQQRRDREKAARAFYEKLPVRPGQRPSMRKEPATLGV